MPTHDNSMPVHHHHHHDGSSTLWLGLYRARTRRAVLQCHLYQDYDGVQVR